MARNTTFPVGDDIQRKLHLEEDHLLPYRYFWCDCVQWKTVYFAGEEMKK